MRLTVALFAIIAPITGVCGADVTVVIRDDHGDPVGNSVVTFDVPGASPAYAEKATRIHQKNRMFVPEVVVVRTGSSISFPNDDPVLHHVYSFSPAKTFELELYGRSAEPAVEFDKAGVVKIGCNIHDHMRAYIYVTSDSHAAVSADDGRIRFTDVPPGRYDATVWHPRAVDAGNAFVVSPSDESNEDVTVTLALRPDRRGGEITNEYEREDYE